MPTLENMARVLHELQLTLNIHTTMLNALLQHHAPSLEPLYNLPAGLEIVKDKDSFAKLNDQLHADDTATALVSDWFKLML